MHERTYYSTQTTLAYEIQSQIYQSLYLYVAVEFDPPGNHPTSNPRLIAEAWCRVATGKASDDDFQRWEEHKRTLRDKAFGLEADGFISEQQLEAALDRVALSILLEAAPILLTIPHDDSYTRLQGNTHQGFEETEVEFRIPDLKRWHTFTETPLRCEALDIIG